MIEEQLDLTLEHDLTLKTVVKIADNEFKLYFVPKLVGKHSAWTKTGDSIGKGAASKPMATRVECKSSKRLRSGISCDKRGVLPSLPHLLMKI